jgi:YidC/Oxa1 family membrane protein insertase
VVEWFLTNIGDPVVNALTQVLVFFHDLVEPAAGVHSWGWAIVMLTLVVRIAMLPLAIKQTRSMRAMQKLQPQMKELQKKYKVDRSLMKKDPEQYKAKKQKLNEEMMALYQREGANPAASCLPILAQAPIFIALFWTLVRSDDLVGEPFYFVTRYVPDLGLTGPVSGAGWPGWLLIALMSGTMFLAQKQMMARNPAQAEGPMAQQQKIMLYAMPAFLAFISFRFPLGVLLYWVTTNFWQVAQQGIILREVKHELEQERAGGVGTGKSATTGGDADRGSKGATSGKAKGGGSAGASSGKQQGKGAGGAQKKKKGGAAPKKGGASPNGQPAGGGGKDKSKDASGRGSGANKKSNHIPRRGGGRQR